MAVLALTAVGSLVGGALLPGGISLLGATLSGAAIGGAIGGLAGAAVDSLLLTPTVKTDGPRLVDGHVTTSIEGAPILRVYGKMRVGGQVIWASRLLETSDTESSGGKGGGGVESTTYSYFASFALGLCEGQINGVGRIWADGEEISRADYTIRVYEGGELQAPDPKIVAVEGADFAPAYRGLAYLLFEDLPLERFGNRVPQITVEVFNRPPATGPLLENAVTGVTLIPGASEFAYATETVWREEGFGAWVAENAHAGGDEPDLIVSLRELDRVAPNLNSVSLIVAWHGTDLRVGECRIKPKVERYNKVTDPVEWRVGAETRETAERTSRIDDTPAIGGAPSDRSVYQAIRALKNRGLKVMVTPFVMMDIGAGNGLPDPYGAEEQAAYPWRGRITCLPAPGRPGTIDASAAVEAQVAAFFGNDQPNDFGWDEAALAVDYYGGGANRYRQFVLHMARIAKAAGGVDAFLIGSEMVALTRLRSAPGVYPAVAELKSLAADVRQMLGPDVRIGYAADWSELPPHRPEDGSGEVRFHLDPLWADEAIDFVGVDNYAPMADWRDGEDHLDAEAGWRGPSDLGYLDANIEGGEGFDWYYADDADRAAQTRTPIVDTAHGEHWVFRSKDFRSWWANAHHDRPGGARSPAPTEWIPKSKPIVFCEIGCPAVDKGANQPNVFVDEKSSESALPHFSNGRRDDVGQRACLLAHYRHWAADAGNNPVSPLTGERMIDPARIHVWTWDARPPSAFPARWDVWADAANWRLGHWLTGRLGSASLRDVVADIGRDVGVAFDLSGLEGQVRGYVIDRIMTPRDAIEPLADAFAATAVARGAEIRIANRSAGPVTAMTPDDLADPGPKSPAFRLTRAQASEVPQTLKLRHVDPDADYRQSAVEARRLAGEGRAVREAPFPIALTREEAQSLADGMLVEASVARETADFVLPPSRLAIEPGDLLVFSAHGRQAVLRVGEIGDEYVRPVKAARADPDARSVPAAEIATRPPPARSEAVTPVFEVMDLPVIDEAAPVHAPRLAAYSKPWSAVAAYRSDDSETFALDQILRRPAVMGRLAAPLPRHDSGRFDLAHAVEVELGPDRTLSSRSVRAVLIGANLAAVRGAEGDWELLQFRRAELVGPALWRLSELLRGQFGTEDAMGDPTPTGAAFVLVDDRLRQSSVAEALRGAELAWRAGPAVKRRDDPRYVARTERIGRRGYLPYAPAHLHARREAVSGDVSIGWIRRSRLGGDDFEAREIRLGEETEAYEVEILSGGEVVRRIETDAPTALYPAAEQIADFGALPAALEVSVHQLSATVGPGVAARATLAV